MWFVRAPRPCRVLGVVLSLIGATWGTAAFSSFEFSKPRWDSTTKFLQVARERLGSARVVLGAQLDWSRLTASDAVVILHPTRTLQFGEVSAFLSSGGRMALLDDFGRGDQLLTRFHIHRTSAPLKPLEMLHGNPRLQLARPTATLGRSGNPVRHSMVSDIEFVATNHPSALAPDESVELTPVLSLSSDDGTQSHFAVIGVIGDALACGLEDGRPRNPRSRCGRLFAMGDPSVFIDLMMGFEGNAALAENLIDYLLEDDAWGKRQGRLFILSNEFDQSGSYGGSGDFERTLDSALNDASQWLSDTRNEGLSKRLSWLAAVVLCALAAVFVLKTSGRPYSRPKPSYATRTSILAMGGVAGRAGVLSADGTRAELVLLELKGAVEVFLRERLALPSRCSPAEILAAIERRGLLGRGSQKRLEQIFKQMAEAEQAVLSSESARFSKESVKDIQTELSATVQQIEQTLRRTT